MADAKDDKDQKPALLTPEQLAQVTEALKPLLAESEKRSAKSAEKAMNAALSAGMEKAFEGFAPKLTELVDGKIAALSKGDAKQGKEKADEKGEPPKPPAIQDDPEFKKLAQIVATQQKELAAAKQQAANERAANRKTSLRASVTSELGKYGISGARANIALSHLLANELVRHESDASDTIVFAKGDETSPLADGLKTWIGTEEGKMLLPPSGATGSGDTGKGSVTAASKVAGDLGQILTGYLRN